LENLEVARRVDPIFGGLEKRRKSGHLRFGAEVSAPRHRATQESHDLVVEKRSFSG